MATSRLTLKRWIAAAAVVLVIAAGAGWLKYGNPAKAPQAAVPPPPPAVGVRLAAMKGVSQSFAPLWYFHDRSGPTISMLSSTARIAATNCRKVAQNAAAS